MENQTELQASFSTLILSMASSAAMALGLAPDPQTEETRIDLNMAQLNIDFLSLLENKTKGNLSEEESHFLKHIITDLQMKFVQAKKKG